MSEPFSTFAGVATRDEAYRKLMHHLEEAENQANVIGHLTNTETGGGLLAKGWYGIGEMLHNARKQIMHLAMRRMQ
jgi:hypothetical protein